ncbi:MAG: transcription antitermination factor NusB [Acholeplasmataceae bacterium]|nr:transcription antitermination factor NusB [Acholeplasmataceae bacterium]
MKADKRTLRIELMNHLYAYDIHQGTGFDSLMDFENEETKTIFETIISHLDEIDSIIEANLFDYRLQRLSYVDRAIIRLAVYELAHTETPPQIIINEAIELTKIYASLDDMKQHKFNNRLLDNIARHLKD